MSRSNIRTKDSPSTPTHKVLGELYQKWGAEINKYLLFHSSLTLGIINENKLKII